MLGNEVMIRRRQTMHSAGYRNTDGMIRRHHYFQFDVNSTQVISGQFSTVSGQEISVDWGDGSARDTYSGTDQAWSHDYGAAVNATVRIFGSVVLTKFMMTASDADISFDVANLPSSLIHTEIKGTGTVSGDLSSLPRGLTYIRCIAGGNIITGDLSSLPRGLTYFSIWGVNTITGSLSDLPQNLTMVYCLGNNTIFGDVKDIPASTNYVYITGENTIANYTSKTWTTKLEMFKLIPVSPGGLSTAEIDQLLIDFDDDLTWASGDVITLTGSNAVPSSASDAAVNNMTSEGATVTTNT